MSRWSRPGLWLGWAHLLLTPVTLALFIVDVVGLALIPITAGIPLVAVGLPATVAVAGLHRRMAATVLGREVPALYRERTESSAVGRLLGRWRDPQTWRDLAWLLVSTTVGFAISLTAVVVFGVIFFYLLFPFLLVVTPDGVMDQPYGLFTVDTVPEAMAQWVLAGVAFALWWWVVPQLIRAKAAIDASLLGPTEAATRRVLEARVEELAATRSEAVDVQAAEVRRIERDLHDGAQARLAWRRA
jgi:hypothetical protein